VEAREMITGTREGAQQATIPASARRPSAGRSRLNEKMLLVSGVVPPTPYAGAFVAKGLLSQFDPSEVVVASEHTWANPPDQTETGSHRVHFIGKRWNWPKRGQRYFAWLRWFLVPRAVHRLTKLARQENCRLVFATFPEDHLLFAAYLTARRLNIAFYPFFHNTYRENRRGLSRVLANWIQPRVFRHAKVTFVMSEGLKSELESRYPHFRFQTLVHTFSEEIPQFEPLASIDRNHVRFAFLGNINDSNLEALRRFCDLIKHSPGWSMSLYSSMFDWYLRKQGLLSERIRHEQPPDEELITRLRAHDILFLPHGLTGGLAAIEYRTIFPTRTIPSLISGRPILAHSSQESFLTKWLRRHYCAEVVDVPDSSQLRAALERLCNSSARREQLVRNALKAAQQFYAPNVVDELKRTINQSGS
jgi:glycosyltransferase involved in cell wall biosynthesis